MTKKGFTLIELVVSIVIAAIIFISLATALSITLWHTVKPEYYTVAAGLAAGEIDRVTNQKFSNVTSEATTAFAGNFSDYNYQVAVDYVDGADLTQVLMSPTDYKRVIITISRSNFPNVVVTTLATVK
ncbi:MAG: prepilin-type N-terminal cleavage/methylation domain-containing protein [Candidatus Saganbacteria bacterium]|nr:prepilin-type N-terminal cleavage/methylation domain-containing protein [Candidatus Saganbacteria bacterium]